MGSKPTSPHKMLRHKRKAAMVPVGDLQKGDHFYRQGTPHMRVEVAHGPETQGVWVCNLVSGSVWKLDSLEPVWPSYDVELTYRGGEVS